MQLTAYATRDWRTVAHRALHRRRLGVGADAVAGGVGGALPRRLTKRPRASAGLLLIATVLAFAIRFFRRWQNGR